MSSEEGRKNIKIKLKNIADSIRDFIIQLGKLRQDLLDLSSKLEELAIIPESEKEKTETSETPLSPVESPQILPQEPVTEITSLPETEQALSETVKTSEETPKKVEDVQPVTESTPAFASALTSIEKPVKTSTIETTTSLESTAKELKTEQLRSVSDLGTRTTTIPTEKVVSILNELEQLCGGSLPAEEVANKIESTKKSLQSLILFHPVYYEMDKIIKKLRTTPNQPLNPDDRVMLLSKIPEWKRRII
ncbi:MAG: hypothetical protein QXV37_03545 [Candidatus Jordarchaeaceae archaeon]